MREADLLSKIVQIPRIREGGQAGLGRVADSVFRAHPQQPPALRAGHYLFWIINRTEIPWNSDVFPSEWSIRNTFKKAKFQIRKKITGTSKNFLTISSYSIVSFSVASVWKSCRSQKNAENLVQTSASIQPKTSSVNFDLYFDISESSEIRFHFIGRMM